VARYGALIGPLPVMLGTALIVFELGAPFRAFNLFKLINLSPMSIGSWLLGLFMVLSALYAATFLTPERWHWAHRAKIALAWMCVPIGIGVAVYTGVMIGAMPARPFWNSPIIAFLFLLSALSAGVAGIVLTMTLMRKHSSNRAIEHDFENSSYLLTASDAVLLAGELLIIFLFIMFAHLTIGSTKEAVKVILSGGALATAFWGLVVVLGIVLPLLLELRMVVPRLLYNREFRTHPALDVALPVAILVGGFSLRYVVVVAGQLTGPVGL
jgi:formate-dependent nitrite reductase membrane component NrfD